MSWFSRAYGARRRGTRPSRCLHASGLGADRRRQPDLELDLRIGARPVSLSPQHEVLFGKEQSTRSVTALLVSPIRIGLCAPGSRKAPMRHFVTIGQERAIRTRLGAFEGFLGAAEGA